MTSNTVSLALQAVSTTLFSVWAAREWRAAHAPVRARAAARRARVAARARA